jgi:hypothetical protein
VKAKAISRVLVGVWLSPVEHCVRDAGVAGSNPATPTIILSPFLVNRDSYRDRNVLDPPDPPETRSPAAANGRANRKDFQHHEHIESHESPQARGNMPYCRPRQIFSNDVEQLRGVVSVITARDRVEGADFFRVSRVSRGGDVVWTSPPLPDLDRADAGAEVLVAFSGATVSK